MKTGDIQITLPTSKSLSIRWLLANHLCGARVKLAGISDAADVKALKRILAKFSLTPGKPQDDDSNVRLHCGESATVARFMLEANIFNQSQREQLFKQLFLKDIHEVFT